MKESVLRYLTCLLLSGCFAAAVSAQEINPTVSQIRETFNNLNFERTIELSTRAISAYDSYPVQHLVLIYQYRAMAFYNLGSEPQAAAAFRSALLLEPALELDPVTVSPKIRNFFSEIKSKHTAQNAGPSPGPETRYIVQEDIRPQAAWRSIVLPGWGQHYKGQELKGYTIFSGFMLNSIGLITAFVYERSAREAYLDATHPADIASRYRDYEKWNNVRRILTGTEIVIWLFAFGDALWSDPISNASVSVRISPTFISASVSL